MDSRTHKLLCVCAAVLLLISALPPGALAAGGSVRISAEVYPQRTVTVQRPLHGTVIVLAPLTVYDGDTVSFIVTPDPGYVLSAAYCGGVNVMPAMVGDTYTVTVSGNLVFSVAFEAKPGAVSGTGGGKTYTMPFVDVPKSEYFYDAVKWAAQNAITAGTDDAHFSPYAPVTRAEVVTFLWRAAGCPKPKGNAGRFVDVEAGSFYEKAVAWATEQGVTKGTSETTFSPHLICSRAQIVTFLARFAGVKDTDSRSVFEDVKSTDYFAAAVRWAKNNGVTEGTSDTTFSPDDDCTRAQAVTFLYRWMIR